jgi:protein-disulfide isomerase
LNINLWDRKKLSISTIIGGLTLVLLFYIHADISTYYIGINAEKSNQQQNLSLHYLIQNGSPFLGNMSAPITIIDFGDFQCYLCNRYVKYTEPSINQTYVQTGKVALVFMHLPNRGLDSMGAALAAQCTNDRGKFWQFHNLLYSNQKSIDSGWVNKENLKKFAIQIPGLDMKQFNSCFDNEKYRNLIQNDIDIALSFGIKETPSFIIENSNGTNVELLAGAQPFPSFQAILDKKISSK